MSEPNVATPIAAYNRMAKHWELPLTLMGGTMAMREAARKYLPQEAKETSPEYAKRLSRTILFNAFRRTVRILGGMPFAKPATLKDETAPRFEAMEDDVDLQGRDLTAFSHALLQDILTHGLAHILVDFPSTGGRLVTGARTTAARAYFAQINPSSLIGWRATRVDGKETLEQIRIYESAWVPDGDWGEKKVERVRVVEPGGYTVWEKQDDDRWLAGETVPNTLKKVALVTVYANRAGTLQATPPLEDLAWLNLRHWQSQSDQDNILHVARVPILHGAGFKKGELTGTEIGASRAIRSNDPNAKLEYVEHSGKGIGAGREDLLDLENRMQVMGAELLVKKPGTQTATAKAIDTAESISDLQSIVRKLESGLEQAFELAGEWHGERGLPVGVDIHQDFGMSMADASDLQTLLQSRLAGEVSQRTFLAELKRRAVLTDSLDVDEEITRIQTEAPNGGGGGVVPFIGAA